MASGLTNTVLIAKREYLERVRAKSFLVMTVLIPVLMGGLLFGAAYVNERSGSTGHVAVVTSNPSFAADLQAELSQGKQKKATVEAFSPNEPDVRAKLDAELRDKNSTLDGYLVVTPAATADARPQFTWVPRSKADIIGKAKLAEAVRAALLREHLAASGMGAAQVSEWMKPVSLDFRAPPSSSTAAFGSAYGMFFLMYFVILFYGMNVARSVIEEKTNRVFEVLLATIRPGEMLAGKVIGVGAVGLTQVGIWMVLAMAGLKSEMIGGRFLPSASQALLFVLFFVMGYVLYSSVAAALGAITNSEQELQQLNIFLMLPLIACSVVIFNVVTSPDGALAKWFSFFPFCTPLIMYTRIVVGKPGALQIGLSVAEVFVTIALVLWVAARIYRVGILMYGKKPNLPEIVRWMKYS